MEVKFFYLFPKTGYLKTHPGLDPIVAGIFHWSVAYEDAKENLLTRITSVKEKHISILCAGSYFPILEMWTSLLLYLISIYRIDIQSTDIPWSLYASLVSGHINKASITIRQVVIF